MYICVLLLGDKTPTLLTSFVAVPDRNRILFHHVFRAHHRVRRATALSFHLGRGSYVLSGCIRYSCIYIARMSLTLSGSSALQRIKIGDVFEIRNRIIFDFCSGLPHLLNQELGAINALGFTGR